MKRIAFISGLQLLPATSGGTLRSSCLARALTAHGFVVEVYSLVGRKDDLLARRPSELVTHGPALSEYIDRSLVKGVVQYASYWAVLPPLWIDAYLRLRTPAALRERLARADAVIADFPFLGRVLDGVQVPTVLNTHNIEHHLLRAQGWRAPLRAWTQRLEVASARAADVVCCCSDTDQEFFRAAGAREVLAVPNGIDVARFASTRDRRGAVRAQLGIADDETVFLFTASRFGPNREAFDWLLAQARALEPQLRARRVRLLVVGSVVTEPVQTTVLTATGRVEQVEPYFAAADFALNPMLGGAGTNVKMSDFIAARLPILSTSFGARGFRFDAGVHGLLLDTAAPLQGIDQALRRSMADRAVLVDAAFAANADRVDMERCVEPLARWLRSRTG